MFMDMSFNTSHVNVYRSGLLLIFANQSSFNTSYVNVYPTLIYSYSLVLSRFNTSYVNVYHNACTVQNIYGNVSIHPMLMFIGKINVEDKEEGLFQYILC